MAEDMNIPRIRYVGFSKPWESHKLGEIATITSGYMGNSLLSTGQCRLTRIETIADGKVNESKVGYSNKKPDDCFLLKYGDILYSNINSIDHIGKVAQYQGNTQLYHGINLLRLSPNNTISSTFLFYILNTEGKKSWARTHANQAVSQASINQSLLASQDISLCSVKEQQQIGSFFNNLDNLISLHQQKHTQLIAIKKAMLEKMFPKEGENFPELRFAGFTGPWERRKLGELFVFRYGDGNTNPSNGGKYPVFGAGGIQGGYTKYNAENSIVIGHMGDAGCVSWGEGKHFVTYNGTITKAKNKIFSSKFGYYLLLHMNLRKYRGGTGLPFLTYEMLTEMETMSPTNARESKKITNYLTYFDTLITLHQKKIDQLQHIKKAFLDKMFV